MVLAVLTGGGVTAASRTPGDATAAGAAGAAAAGTAAVAVTVAVTAVTAVAVALALAVRTGPVSSWPVTFRSRLSRCDRTL